MNEGYYYLHTNGDLIYKKDVGGAQVADFRESDFVKMFWSLDLSNRYDAWRMLVEAKALGASQSRIDELAEKWGCNDEDAQHFADVLSIDLKMDGAQWCAHRSDFINLAESPAGFGDDCLSAMADLINNLGYKPAKTWGATIRELCS